MLCQRMASDTDLWMSVNKAAQEKYQSSLDAKGSLISESFELWLNLQEKVPNYSSEHFP